MGLKKVILPALGIDMESAVIEKWLKAEGDTVEAGEPLFFAETDKASTEIVSPASGVLKQIVRPEGSTVPVRETVALLEVEGAGDVSEPAAPPVEGARPAPFTAAPEAAQKASPASPPAGSEARQLRASPAARKAAKELGIELSAVPGTGPGGRIQGSDVRAYAERAGTALPTKPTTAGPPADMALPASATGGLPGRLVPLGRKRRLTAERMSLSARTVARLTMGMDVDVSEMTRLRARLLPQYEASHGVRISYNDLLVRAAATALRDHPYLNARWTDEGVYLVEPVNVGVAVAVDDGLVVPVIKHSDQKSLVEIAVELSGLLARAREDRLSYDDLAGGTFTITNLGMFGVDFFTPIVNPPEAAILGVGRIAELAARVNGEIVLLPTMTLSLSFDHRVVDGAPAAQFLQRVKALLEEPYLLI